MIDDCSMLRLYSNRERITHSRADNLTILDAAEKIVTFCLAKPNRLTEDYASRLVVAGLNVAVEFRQALGFEGETEPWISKLRIASTGNPFDASAGLEIRLPYGINTNGKPEDSSSAFYDGRMGAFASYPLDGMGWIAHPVGMRGELDIASSSVWKLDNEIAKGRPDDPNGREWVGFYLADVLAKVM